MTAGNNINNIIIIIIIIIIIKNSFHYSSSMLHTLLCKVEVYVVLLTLEEMS